MNNNIPIARWLSMFWLCSAVSLVLGQFSGSVTLNGTNGAALTVTGILGIFCTLVQFYPFYRFSRVSERLQRAFTATVLSVAATVVGLLAMTLVPSDTPPYTPSTFYLLFSLIALAGGDRSLCLAVLAVHRTGRCLYRARLRLSAQAYSLVLLSFPYQHFAAHAANFYSIFLSQIASLVLLAYLSALHIKRKKRDRITQYKRKRTVKRSFSLYERLFVESRFIHHLDRQELIRAAGTVERVCCNAGSVAVPCGRTIQLTLLLEGLDPMGQLNVIGFNKAVLPVGQDRERTGCVRALDNRIRIRQVDCALLADDLTLDVVTVSVRNLNLYVNASTGLGFQQHDLRVVITPW